MPQRALEGLNEAQREAATATTGPVCILAGAGSGKTTSITRRIAYQIGSGAFRASEVLALTFTERAANEMRERLERLGTGRVRARTFHAEALAQVAHFASAPELVDSKARILAPMVRRLPPPYRFRATRDVASEIERAKNRRIGPDRYLDALDPDHTPPLPPETMAGLYTAYEDRKRRAGQLDFEDLLELAIRLMEDDEAAAAHIRARYRAFTVDEYQDVNLLQQTLLERWLGGRDDVCVVGDDYQSIYGFTGATADYLLDFPRRYPQARVVALVDNYRSTPEVLEVANRLVPALGGRPKKLRAAARSGAKPAIVEQPDGEEETRAVVAEIKRLAAEGTALEEIAILYRINARSEDYEEALAAAGIPYQVRDGAFLRRPGPREALRRLRRADPATTASEAVTRVATGIGWEPEGHHEGAEEVTRQADLTRLVRLAEEAGSDLGAFLADLAARFEGEGGGRGVVLSTYHRAKGLEWDVVFLPRLEERELPFATARSDAHVAEERRLLYVGITRARHRLYISWALTRGGRKTRPSRFVAELNRSRLLPRRHRPSAQSQTAASPLPANGSGHLFEALKAWRKRVATEGGVPAYVVFHDATLRTISERRPRSLEELAAISGVGPRKLQTYGPDIVELVGRDAG